MAPTTVERVALYDVVNWTTPTPGRPDRPQYHTARLGERITLPVDEAERLEAFDPPAVGTALEAAAAIEASGEPPSWSDEQLDSASADDVFAYLGQHPSEADRVLERERARSKSRKTVITAAERVKSEYAGALEAAADDADLAAAAAAEAEAARTAAPPAPGAPSIPA